MDNCAADLQSNSPINLKQFTALLLLLFFLSQTFLIYIFAEKGLIPILILLLSTLLLIFIAFSVERIYYLFAFYVAVAPAPVYLRHFPGVPIYYALRFAIPLFGLVLFFWIIYLLRNHEEKQFDLGFFDRAILLYLFLVIISAMIGFLRGFSFPYVMNDLLPHLYWIGYFIFRYSPLKLNVKKFFDVILFIVIAVSAEFIYGFSQAEGLIFFRRIVARSIHLTPFAVAYIGATFIYGQTKLRKILFGCLLPGVLFAVLICQQRSLWFGTILMLFALFVLYVYSRRELFYKHIKRALIFSGIALSIVLVFVLNIVQTPWGVLLHSRLLIFLDPRLITFDVSWWTRGTEIARALANFGSQFLLGGGLGDTIVSPLRYFILFAPDNAYIYLLWKMGILGFSTFIIIHIIFIQRCFLILRRKTTSDDKIFALTGLLNILALMIIGFANACVSQYEFLIIWTALMAAIETVARRYE